MAGQRKVLRQLLAALAVACIVDHTGGSATYRTQSLSEGQTGYIETQGAGQTHGKNQESHSSMQFQSQGMKKSSQSYSSSYSSGRSSSSQSYSSSSKQTHGDAMRKSSSALEGQVHGSSMGLKSDSGEGQGGLRSQSYSSSGSVKHSTGGQGGSVGMSHSSGSQGASRSQSYSYGGQTEGGTMSKSYSYGGQVQGGTRNPPGGTGAQGQSGSTGKSYGSGITVERVGSRPGSQLVKTSDGQSMLFKLEYTDEQRIQHLNSQREAARKTGGGYSVGTGDTLAEARRQVEEERRRKAEEERRQAEEDRRRQGGQDNRQAEEERRRQVEEERRQAEEDRRQGGQDNRQAEEERRRQVEEERRRQVEEERRRQAEEERRRLAEERRREGEELRMEREKEERMRLEEERRREEARAQARRQQVDRRDDDEERRLIQERQRAEEQRRIADRQRQERIEEERAQRQRELEMRRVSGEPGRQTNVTQRPRPRPTPVARSSGARRDSLVRSRCTDCQVGNETFRGHSRFEYTENCQKYRCICHCDGSHDCPAHYTVNVCDQDEDKERRRLESTCKTCDAKGKIVKGNNYFDLQDGCILHKNCKCFCDGRWECSANRTENTCVKKVGEGSCGECEVYGSFHPGNSRFKYEEGCFEYNCDCSCNGSWSCPPDRTRDICQKGCGECEIRGEFFEGNTYFNHEKGCLEYTCFCHCNGSWNCSGDRVKNICEPTEQPDKCSQCQVSETNSYPGNSTFQLRKKCISYECSCKCDGSWDCPGVLARNICRGERPGGCKSCQVSDEEFYPGDSDFDMRKGCIHYKCNCNCDGSWSCPGEKARDVCKGEVPGGCKSCKLSETEFYRGESDFQMRRDCIHYSCHCNCDGSWNCPGAAARNVCRGEIPGGCRSCQLSDGKVYRGKTNFRQTIGCVVKECRCSCNGTVDCDEETAVNVCTTPAPTRPRQRTVRPRQNLDNCQKCMVEGNDYEPNSSFKLKRGCYVYPCQCNCNGRWGCNRDGAVDVCASKSAAQGGSLIGQSSCKRCIVQGRTYPGDTDFRLRRGCISYKCKCACDGRWECPADKASNFCPGSREPTVGCKRCEVDGQSYTVDSNFDMRRGCVRYKCKCRCDGSYGCHVTQDSACTIGERPASCGNCEIDGYVYPGNMGFVIRDGCMQKECNCYCNGSYICPDENRIDICRNKHASRFLRDGTFTSTGNLGETFGSGTQVFNQGGEQYTVTRRNQFRGGHTGNFGQVDRTGQHIRTHGTQFQIPGGPMFPQGGRPYVLRGSIPLGGPISPGQIVTRGGKQYVLRQFMVPGRGQFIPIGAIPYSAQRNFYQQIIDPALRGQGNPGMGASLGGANGQYSHAQYSLTGPRPDAVGSLHGGVPTYDVRTSHATGGSRTVHTARTYGNQGGAGRMAYGSAVFQVKAPYTPGKRTRHVGQVAVNPRPGCNNCSVEGQTHKGGSTFQITKDCVQFNCSCECSGSWTCSGEFSTGCNSTEPSRKPQGDDAGTCKRCSLKGSTYPGDSTFQLVQDCSEYTCTCTCSGKWYCPVQKPRNICDRTRGELRQRTASCQLCDVRGTDYPPQSEFLLKEGCVQYKCTCNCDGTWVCPPANSVNVCQEDREEERREREEAARKQRYTTRLPQSWGNVFTTNVPVGQGPKTRYSNTRNGISYKQTSCQSCVVKGKSYIPENEFKFREGCTQYKCQCFCNGTWECPAQDTINLCRSPDYRIDGCKQCEVKNETYPGGSPFRYREGCWEFSCFCGCNGEWSCPANRTTDMCKHSGSVSPKCKPCMIEGKVIRSKSNFNMRRGCSEFLCECNCDGSWTCPKDRSLNICEGEGKTPSPHYKLKGCTVGNRTFFSRLFAYTEDCVRYMCICYDSGAWKCPAQKNKRVC